MGLYVFLLFRGTGPDAGHSLVALSNEHADDWETLRCYINEDILQQSLTIHKAAYCIWGS
ncbi:MAG: hypothetical protein ACOX8T_09575, partial [Bacillota bacterium]|jgi:hypothetical protein